MKYVTHAALIAGVALAAGVVPTHAKTTTAAGNGNWNDAIWNNGAPANGDTVEIAFGVSVTLTNATPELASFDNQGTFTFSGSNAALRATNVLVNGTVVVEAAEHTGARPGSVIRRD